MVRTTLFRLLFCVLFIVPASGVVAPPLTVTHASAPTASRFQLYAHLESWDRQLQAVDASTLRPVGRPPRLALGSPGDYQPTAVLASADGRTVAVISDQPLANNQPTQAQYRQAMTIRIIDARTGKRRADFHPAVPFASEGLSADGSQLFGWRTFSTDQPEGEWDAVSTADGSVVGKVRTYPGCCVQTLYDPAAHRFYGLDVPSSASQPTTPSLLAYDLVTGRLVGRLSLPGVLAGGTMVTDANNDPIYKSWSPGIALNPDGSQIAILDGQSNRLDVIDARQLTIVRTLELSQPQSLLSWLGQALGVAPTTAAAKEWLGVALGLTYSADGRYLYVTGQQGAVGPDGKWTVTGLGLRQIDVATGQVMASGLPNRWVTQVLASPDGSALYAVDEPAMGGGSATVARLDPATLQVQAQRSFFDPPQLYFLVHRARVSPSWLQAWPMPGHDPQRTNRSPVSGPLTPHLLFQRTGLFPALAGPDGTIYASSARGLVALTATGQVRWTVQECCGEGPPVLAPDGMIMGNGFRHGPPADQADTEALGIHPDGTVAWRIQPLGVLKGAVPLVSRSNVLYLPIVGPEGVPAQGLDVITPAGKLLRKLPRVLGVALGKKGQAFGITFDDGALAELSAAGKELWHVNLQSGPYGTVGPLVGRNGTVYVGNGADLIAVSPSGTVLWRYPKADGTLALAERADGVVLVAGRQMLDAVSPHGTRRWQVAIGHSRGAYAPERPSLIVDGDGTAYVGTGDGLILAISRDGEWLASFDGGGRHLHLTPSIILGADGRLVVGGTDGVLRVYAD